MSMIEKALGIALQWAVFEPNGFLTRARATMSVDVLPRRPARGRACSPARTRRGVVLRACDLDNNPAEQRDLGRAAGRGRRRARRSRSSSSCSASGGSATRSRCATAGRARCHRDGVCDVPARRLESATGIRLDPPLNHNFLVMMADTSSTSVADRHRRRLPARRRAVRRLLRVRGPEDAPGGREAPRGRAATTPSTGSRPGSPGPTWCSPAASRGSARAAGTGCTASARAGSRRMDGIVVLLDDRHLPHNIWKFRRGIPGALRGTEAQRHRATRSPSRCSRSRTRACGSCPSSRSAPRRLGVSS